MPAQQSKLHKLAAAGDADALAAALAGAEVDTTDSRDRTPLHAAAAAGAVACIRLLLERDADVDAEDEDGNTALHLAAQAGHAEAVTLLLEKSDEDAENGEGNTPAFLALQGGHECVADVLWDGGADVNLACEAGATCLHLVRR
jgi:hypothetical protein